jgi:S-adenosylmethionine:tRNA ribosyltransferase-isomerase
MSSISTLLTSNLLDVFGENDSARRRAAIDEIYTEDGVFYDPTSGAHRAPPPPLRPSDRIALGPLTATIERWLGHPRLVSLRVDGPADAVWAGIARHGRPIQYAHLSEPLALWDVWTSFAGPPVAFEAPSAGFALDWGTLSALRERGVAFATVTHAAGISSTGDAELDRRLPFDEPYRVPPAAARAVLRARERGGRVVAVGTTVVRALESAATTDGRVRAGDGVATLRIGPATSLRVVDAILTGVHEAGTSHHELLRAFAADAVLDRAAGELAGSGYRIHEFGDSVFIERHQAGADSRRPTKLFEGGTDRTFEYAVRRSSRGP